MRWQVGEIMRTRKHRNDMSFGEKWEHDEMEDNARWERSVRAWPKGSPYSGMRQPEYTMYVDGIIKRITNREYLSNACARCEFVDAYCIWDNRFGGHRKNIWFCQTCFVELREWISINRVKEGFNINDFLDTKPEHYIAPVAEQDPDYKGRDFSSRGKR